MRRLIAIAVVLVLSACNRGGSDGQPVAKPSAAPPPAAAPVKVGDFSQPIDARGTEPFWALRIRGAQITLIRPEQPDLVAQTPAPDTRSPGRATWAGRTADGQPVTVTVYVSDCSDGMSDLRYPMAAQVELAGVTQLSGCAAKTSEMPKGER